MRMKKIPAIFIIIILLGVSFHSTISTAQPPKKPLEKYSIDVEFFGVETTEKRNIALSNENMEKLTFLIKNINEKIVHAQTLEEIHHIYTNFLPQLSEILNLDRKIQHQLQTSFQTMHYLNRLSEKNGRFVQGNQQNTTNHFCYIMGDTTNTTVFRIYNILPKPFFNWLNEKLYYWIRIPLILFFVLITIYPLHLLSTFIIPYALSLLPANVMTVLTLGATWAPSMGWVYTNGGNGIKKWDSPLYGHIGIDQRWYLNLPAAFYPAILGFTGIKINLGQFNGPWYLMSHQFFFGTAVFVSIDNED